MYDITIKAFSAESFTKMDS